MQIWLMKRLDIIAKPTTGNYGPNSFLSKTVIKNECQIESDWGEVLEQEIQYLNPMELLLVEVPTPFCAVSRIRSYFPSWVKENDFLQS